MSSPKRPNILLIMSDNQSADYVGCYGNDEIKTPAIDRLADTWPQNWNAIGEFETLPTRFSKAGYSTALIGKYHRDLHRRSWFLARQSWGMGVWGHGLAAWPSSMHRPSYNIPLIIAGPGVAGDQGVLA